MMINASDLNQLKGSTAFAYRVDIGWWHQANICNLSWTRILLPLPFICLHNRKWSCKKSKYMQMYEIRDRKSKDTINNLTMHLGVV